MKDLSIIILSYNTLELTKACLDSLATSLSASKNLKSEIIMIDNASVDGSADMLKDYKKKVSSPIDYLFVANKENVGYPKGNNQGIKMAKGKYVLLLNSDVLVNTVDWNDLIDQFKKNPKLGGLTVEVNLPTGGIDPASHRGFPTPWNAFCYYSKLEKLLGKVPVLGALFGGYHLTQYNLKTIHEIDAPTGAFFLIPKSILDDIHGFDEGFFMYGEDVDLAYRIKQSGYSILYYPKYSIIHYKHKSGLKGQTEETRKRTRENFYKAMKIFYKKHYEKKYPLIVTKMMYFFIDLKKNLS